MFKTSQFLVLLAIGVACAIDEVPILHQESIIEPDGSYKYSFETGDGFKANAVGELKQVEKEVVEVSQGAYSYPGDDGQTYSVNYVADENGYRPTGDHIPGIPVAIQRSLDHLATAQPPKKQ